MGYGKKKARMYLHILPFISVCYWLTLIHALDEYMYVYMHVLLLSRMHEDMLFYEGECVTHWEFRFFSGFSGELVSFMN